MWFPLQTIENTLRCYCCAEEIHIPVYLHNKVMGDAFRLNELIATAVDQGVFPVLLTILFLANQRFFGKRFIYDYEVFSGSNCLAEVDLVFTLGKRLGLAEVKADRGFNQQQVDRLLSVSIIAKADMLLFSTLKSIESEEVRTLFDYLSLKSLAIPAFIIGRESLFQEDMIDISSYFEVIHSESRFPTGPIILK